MDNSKTDIRGFQILLWAALAVSCLAIICSCLSLGTMGQVYGVAPGIGDIITYLLQIHSFVAFFLGWACLAFLFAHDGREGVVKTCCWAVLILVLLHIAPFFTDSVFYMNTVSFSAGLNYFSAYVPGLMAAVVFVTLLSNWNETSQRTTNRVALICGLISVFMLIVYLAQVFPLMSLTSTLHDNAQLWGLVFGNSTITLAVVVVWALTLTRRGFERLLFDMTDDEAFAFELVAQRLDAASDRIEQEVERELAEDARQEAEFEAAGGAAGIVDEAMAREAKVEAPERLNPLVDRWTAEVVEEEEDDPLDELWRPEPPKPQTQAEQPREVEPRRGRFVPASENRPGTRLPRRDDPNQGTPRR
ncbi:MAG: hypothetical protein HDQ87_11355 [Clostridia bacterium]|nr:hypothetical protein [Clostridia bacterium]